ncbi:MAG: GNAT family N-acetyltransferase, partial [Oscillospiraceae bacterium]
MNEKALEYLNRDRLLHIDMLEALKRGAGEVVFAHGDGVVVLNADYTYMISAESEETLERICAEIKRPELIAMHQARFVPFLQSKYEYKHSMVCFQCAYMSGEKLDIRISEGIELRALTMDKLDFVFENYDHPSDRSYIAERLEAGMIGAFCGDDIAGFVGTHTEGTMGMLQVMPEYRRRGIAYTLEAAMINNMLDKGYVPHAHIVTTNGASVKL